LRLTEPIDDAGQPMITVRAAAQIIGRERSWITRQLHAGALRGGKIGNEWWTTRDWALQYRHTRSTPLGQEQLSSNTTPPPTPRSLTEPLADRL